MLLKKFIMLLLLVSANSFALPYAPGEQLTYSVQWKYGLVLITAGHLTSTLPEPTQDKDGHVVYAIQAKVKSSGVTNTFYPFGYTLSSIFDQQGFFSRGFEMHGKEKTERKDQVQMHHYANRELSFWQKVFDEKKNEAPNVRDEKRALTEPTQDVLSVLYLLRTAPLPAEGHEYRFNAAWEGEVYTVVVKGAGQDKIRFDGKKIESDIYLLDFYKDGILGNTGTKLWMSRDTKRVPLKLESKVQVGNIWVKLDSIN